MLEPDMGGFRTGYPNRMGTFECCPALNPLHAPPLAQGNQSHGELFNDLASIGPQPLKVNAGRLEPDAHGSSTFGIMYQFGKEQEGF